MKFLSTLAMILLVVGGLNWGLVGAFNLDLVSKLFGDMTTMSKFVYVLVGLSAVWKLFCFKKCSSSKC